MTETHPVSESYKSLRDSVENVEACAAWTTPTGGRRFAYGGSRFFDYSRTGAA